MEAAALRLLGRAPAGIDGDALAAIGIDLDLVRSTIEEAFGPGAWRPVARRPRRRRWRRDRSCPPAPGCLRLTPRLKACLERALRESLALRHRHIGAEHVALALTTTDQGVVPELFAGVGMSPAQVRAAILDRYRRAG